MKQKDMILIGVIIFISTIISLVLSNLVFASPKTRNQQVEVIQPITADFPKPDQRYFNKDAIDPTKLITIGQNQNPAPFSATSQ